ncbi:MAG TPA: carboxymuconolactone decarboxylase family protein [Candidatus Dormibacteraeota bacterium]|jgi:AhpD family alkylhydroperoxidase|nr:carboxymuconolactone decarboxylase family protein [Candidatus Dormibacteraeota bacterium]
MRISYHKVLPESYETLLHMSNTAHDSGLEPALQELVRIRASQINGCAFCLDMHTKDARAGGETEQRLNLLAAWRESPGYTERERAALAWCEAVTLIAETSAPDDVYEEVRRHFDERETVALTLVVISINGWNRMLRSMRTPAGDYVSRIAPAAGAASR